MRLSVRGSLTIWFCLVFFCGVFLLGLSAYIGLRSTIIQLVDSELRARLDGVDNFLREHVNRFPRSRVEQDLSVHFALKPLFLIIHAPQGELFYCGSAVRALCSANAATISHPFLTVGDLRLLSAIRIINGAPYRISVASELTFQSALLGRFSLLLLIIAPMALASATLGGYWLVGRALAPVRDIIQAVHSIGEQSLSMRLHVPVTGDEIQLLSETLNGMLSRVESAFRRVTELTANASHELRTPVAIIRTSAEIALLNARPTVESHRQALMQVCAEAEKNTRLLDSMLMLARTDSGAQALHFARISLERSVRQAVNACRYLAEAKDIALIYEENVPGLYLWADPTHLNRLWLVLLDNAIKYTPPGGQVTVTILCSSSGAPICEIADSGIGIAPNDLPNIFERFFRAENARLVADSGSGLGLPIARWIADVHHAQLNVESIPGAGSIFRVMFQANMEFPTPDGSRNEVTRLLTRETPRMSSRSA
jgi:two-component system, OmpR family, heavy metal sensor histidine kinase CusS